MFEAVGTYQFPSLEHRIATVDTLLAVVTPELERRDADLALAQERIDKTRQALRLDEKWSVQHGALAVRSERDRAVAERDALRAQLAAATPPPEERAELLRLINDRGVGDLDAEELADDVTQLLRPDGPGCWAEDEACAPGSESVPATTNEDAALYAVALDRVRRDKGVRHTLEDVVREMGALDDPSPEATSEASQEAIEWAEAATPLANEANDLIEGHPSPPSAGEADATPRLRDECHALEGMTGIECDRYPGHQDWHSGKHTPRTDGTESVGYPVHIQWPRMSYDRCAPASSTFREGDHEPRPDVRLVRGSRTGRTYERRSEGYGGHWDYETGHPGEISWLVWEGLLREERSVEVLPNTEQVPKR